MKFEDSAKNCALCNHCYREVHDFQTTDELWNFVVGKPGGVLCYDCFIAACNLKGIYPEPAFVKDPRIFPSE